MHFKGGLVALLLLCLLQGHCLEFKSSISPSEVRCFFEILEVNQKYKIDLYPISGSTYNFYILRENNATKSWQFEYSKQEVHISEFLNVHKLASMSTTYQFCVKNNDIDKKFKYLINISSGLDLLELHLLPDNTDAQNLALEMEWVKKQTQTLRKSLANMSTLRSQTQLVSSLVSNKIVLGVVAFTLVAILMNALFYARIKSSLKQKKLI